MEASIRIERGRPAPSLRVGRCRLWAQCLHRQRRTVPAASWIASSCMTTTLENLRALESLRARHSLL